MHVFTPGPIMATELTDTIVTNYNLVIVFVIKYTVSDRFIQDQYL